MAKEPLNDRARYSLYFVLGLFVFAFMCIFVQAFRIQVVHRGELAAKSSRQVARKYSPGRIRGDIFDRNGVKMATSVSVDSVFVDQERVEDLSKAAWRLSTALEMNYGEIVGWLSNLKSRSAFIKRHLAGEEAEVVRNLRLEGVGLVKEYRREYPNGTLAAHILGFVGSDGQGLEGLEKALNDRLEAGTDTVSVRVRRDGRGRIIMDDPSQVLRQNKGASVVLTLDVNIQRITENAIKSAVINNNAKGGIAVVVRPSTGEILASAAYPTFDPNAYGESEQAARRNKVLTDTFEPGSTFKVFTVAAALEDKVVAPESVLFCENGFYQIDVNNAIRDTGSYGNLTVSQVVQKSSNICAAKIGEILGSNRLHHYLTGFGFGEKTGLAFPAGEAAGTLRPPGKWVLIDAANVAFGQGLAVSGLQLAMAVSSLANDGFLMKPRIVSRIIDAEGGTIDHRPPTIVRQVVSPMVSRQVMAMMRMAVMKGGTGGRAEIPGYPVSGKTGTSQKSVFGEHGYSKNKYVASFVGVAPYNNPALCVLVVLDEPWPSYYGGEVAAPVFKEIMSQALPILNVPKVEEEAPPKWPSLSDADDSAPGVLMASARRPYRLSVVIPRDDKGSGEFPNFDKKSLGDLVFDKPEPEAADVALPPGEGGGARMPSLIGLSTREVFETLAPYGVQVQFLGSGRAVDQDPAEGRAIGVGDTARVRLAALRK
ncbi:MAG: transpeptidase family protein [Deltaproteobacteria bacterium]|nr:transpeptidase family protein [Deltaproteobacteria bacterium]